MGFEEPMVQRPHAVLPAIAWRATPLRGFEKHEDPHERGPEGIEMMRSSPLGLQCVFVAILLVLSALFSGSEAALFSLPPAAVQRLQTAHSGARRRIARLLRNPQELLITILLGNLLVNLMATSSVTTVLVATLGSRAGSWGAWIGMSVLILVVGEITPKVLAVQHPMTWALLGERFIAASSLLLAPARILLLRLVGPLTGQWRREGRGALLERAELQTAVEEAAESGSLHPFEAEVVSALLEIEGIRVCEIMTPRVLVQSIADDAPLEEARRLFRRLRRTRLPVFSGSVDNIVGVLRVHDLVGLGPSADGRRVGQVARPAMFVPENLSVDRLLLRFRSEADDIAIVLDEFGSVAGLVTLHDIVDEVFGPLPDKHDPVSPRAIPRPDGSWVLPGDFPLDHVEAALGVAVTDPMVETIGGRITHVLGRIPGEGETIELPEGLRVTITRADRRRVLEVVVTRPARGEAS